MPFRNRLLLFVWFAYFCSLPLFKAFASVAEVALIILSFWPGTFSGLKPTVLKYKNVAVLTVIFGILLLGMFYTQDLHNGWRILKHQHRFLVIPLLFLVHASLLQQYFRQFLLTFILAACAACGFVILLYLLPETTVQQLAASTKLMLPYPKMVDRTAFGLYSPFIDRIQFASLLAVAIISSIYLWVIRHFRPVLFVALPLLFYTVFILGGRGALVGLFAALLVYGLILGISVWGPKMQQRYGKPTTFAFLVSGGLLLFVGLPYLSFRLIKPMQTRLAQTQWEIGLIENGQYKQFDYEHFTTFRRLVSVKNMWEVVKQNPVFGAGTGDYHPEIKAVYLKNNPEMEVNSHSQYLLFWGMTGLVGLLIFLAVLAYWIFELHFSGPLYFYGLAFLVFYLVNMLPDSVLFTQVDSMVFCTFMALIGLQKSVPERGNHA